MILIRGGGLAGQVLRRELTLKNIPSHIQDPSQFPRHKVCGGVLQWDSWEYLKSLFSLEIPNKTIETISHYWNGKQIAERKLKKPMIYVARFDLDDTLHRQNRDLAGKTVSIEVHAEGAETPDGDWMGFEAETCRAHGLEMHYGRHVYAGVAPTLDVEKSHAAFLMRRRHFKSQKDVLEQVKNELGLEIHGKLRGTKPIGYRRSDNPLAIGDAKLTTHPFLGFGMKHAILSARLMADAISQGRVEGYEAAHCNQFRRQHRLSRLIERVFDSPWQGVLKPFLSSSGLYDYVYRQVHS